MKKENRFYIEAVAFLGGNANNGTNAGFWFWEMSAASGSVISRFGARLTY